MHTRCLYFLALQFGPLINLLFSQMWQNASQSGRRLLPGQRRAHLSRRQAEDCIDISICAGQYISSYLYVPICGYRPSIDSRVHKPTERERTKRVSVLGQPVAYIWDTN